jgi:hypothetical protein
VMMFFGLGRALGAVGIMLRNFLIHGELLPKQDLLARPGRC